MLMAKRLRFVHPVSDLEMEVEAELDQRFTDAISQLNLHRCEPSESA